MVNSYRWGWLLQFPVHLFNKKFQGPRVYICYCYKLSRDPIYLLRFHHHFVPLFLIISISIHSNFFSLLISCWENYLRSQINEMLSPWDFRSYSTLPISQPHPPAVRPRTPRPARTPWHWLAPVLWYVAESSAAALAPVCPRRSGSVAETSTKLHHWYMLS